MASLRLGAEHITGIELNPVTVSLLREHFLDFTGHLAENPRVTLVNSEGRSYLRRSGRQYDLIWLVAPDSYAAMNAATSGAFVLSESYLYTKEMIAEALERLTPGGILCAQFGEIDFDIKPNRVLRYLGTAREAFGERGVEDFASHVLVSVAPGFGRLNSSSILLGKSPFTPGAVEAFSDAVGRVKGGRVVYPTVGGAPDSPIRKAIELGGGARAAFYEGYPYDVAPITDDSPFFWHFVRFGDLFGGDRGFSHFNVEEGIGERMLLVLLGVALAFAGIFLSVPMIALREAWLAVPKKGSVAAYFACLGLGFMFIEVAMIQKLTLLLGYPTYSLTVTLFAILLSTGVGSLLSERWAADPRRILFQAVGALTLLIVAYHLTLGWVVDAGVGYGLPARIGIAIAILAPLGLCLGMFMPIGLGVAAGLGKRGDQIVAWCWAVNGFFSVAGSILSTMLSMGIGFGGVMMVGLAAYALALLAMSNVLRSAPPARTSGRGTQALTG